MGGRKKPKTSEPEKSPRQVSPVSVGRRVESLHDLENARGISEIKQVCPRNFKSNEIERAISWRKLKDPELRNKSDSKIYEEDIRFTDFLVSDEKYENELRKISEESSKNKEEDEMETNSPIEIIETDTANKILNEKKPNPITVPNVQNIIEFAKKLDALGNFNYEIKIAGKYTRLYPQSKEEKVRLSKTLKDNNIPHYITEDRTPLVKVIIRGLTSSFPISELKDSLKEKNFDIQDVSQLKSRKDGRALPLYLIQLPKSKEANQIYKVKNIFKIKIRVEAFRAAKKATQCYRCQEFYHVAANCLMTPRCVVCGDNHESHTCPSKIKKEKTIDDVKCCNCGEKHPASYRGCKAFPPRNPQKKSYAETLKYQSNSKNSKQLKKVEEKKISLKTEKLSNINEFVENVPTLIEVINKIKNELGTESLSEIINKFNKVLNHVAAQTDKLTKAIAFAESMASIFSPSDGTSSAGT